MGAVSRLPFFVTLAGLSALIMFVPAIYAYVLRDYSDMRVFSQVAALLLVLITIVALATHNRRPRNLARSHLLTMAGAYVVLPILFAVPFQASLQNTTFFNAYFEMLSCFTTTGATLYEGTARLGPPLELWRSLVGWIGGFFIWITAAAIFFPLNLGGFEVTAKSVPGRGIGADVRPADGVETSERLVGITRTLLPVYTGLTLVLWICLIVAGDPALIAFAHAAATMSTSGISPIGGVTGSPSGVTGEILVMLFLVFAFSRRTFSSDIAGVDRRDLLEDPEIRVALFVVFVVSLVLFLRHWVAVFDTPNAQYGADRIMAFWGGAFTTVSFLSTTGFVSAGWDEARIWSGLESPGMILVGLALMGGGVATTAGGVKLLRVYALYLHGRRELVRLVYPNLMGIPGSTTVRIHFQGVTIAWIFFMLFALSIGVTTLAFGLTGLSLEASLLFAISALSTAGPLVPIASEGVYAYAQLDTAGKVISMVAMVLGRMETLALIALLNVQFLRS
ncbi:MAG: potassium transporter TrkG [Pseudomonadota bacterium]